MPTHGPKSLISTGCEALSSIMLVNLAAYAGISATAMSHNVTKYIGWGTGARKSTLRPRTRPLWTSVAVARLHSTDGHE